MLTSDTVSLIETINRNPQCGRVDLSDTQDLDAKSRAIRQRFCNEPRSTSHDIAPDAWALANEWEWDRETADWRQKTESQRSEPEHHQLFKKREQEVQEMQEMRMLDEQWSDCKSWWECYNLILKHEIEWHRRQEELMRKWEEVRKWEEERKERTLKWEEEREERTNKVEEGVNKFEEIVNKLEEDMEEARGESAEWYTQNGYSL